MYWHWLAFGMILLIAEIFLASFTIFWFGLGALLVSVILFAAPDVPLSWQLFIWALASSLCAVLWFRYFKPRMLDRTQAGLSREALLGQAGLVIRCPSEAVRGQVRFTTPLLGSEEWPFICSDTVAVGDRVFVKDISGNTLIVSKQNG